MAAPTHRCWSPDDGDEDSAMTVITTIDSPDHAAEVYVESNWSNFDNNSEINVHVRDVVTMELTKWLVKVETIPSFSATKVY